MVPWPFWFLWSIAEVIRSQPNDRAVRGTMEAFISIFIRATKKAIIKILLYEVHHEGAGYYP